MVDESHSFLADRTACYWHVDTVVCHIV